MAAQNARQQTFHWPWSFVDTATFTIVHGLTTSSRPLAYLLLRAMQVKSCCFFKKKSLLTVGVLWGDINISIDRPLKGKRPVFALDG